MPVPKLRCGLLSPLELPRKLLSLHVIHAQRELPASVAHATVHISAIALEGAHIHAANLAKLVHIMLKAVPKRIDVLSEVVVQHAPVFARVELAHALDAALQRVADPVLLNTALDALELARPGATASVLALVIPKPDVALAISKRTGPCERRKDTVVRDDLLKRGERAAHLAGELAELLSGRNISKRDIARISIGQIERQLLARHLLGILHGRPEHGIDGTKHRVDQFPVTLAVLQMTSPLALSSLHNSIRRRGRTFIEHAPHQLRYLVAQLARSGDQAIPSERCRSISSELTSSSGSPTSAPENSMALFA